MGKIIFLIFPLILSASKVSCKMELERIICTYFIDRSDNTDGVKVKFFWHSPNDKDNRVKIYQVPPYYGSVYDYRFLPGRVRGRWEVIVTELDTNKSSKCSFDINGSDDFFED